MTKKIKVTTKCVADNYVGNDEKIIEFSSPVGGGLISFRLNVDGQLIVSVYNTDSNVITK